MATDEFRARYDELLTGSYDCVDRIVPNAYNPLCHNPGGFRNWWRRLHGDDEQLDNTRLMRMAGRFARRVRGYAAAHDVPMIDCGRGVRKHRIAEDYLATHTVEPGVFLILVARAPATVWDVNRSPAGVIRNLAKKKAFVNHYSFHLDPCWGHVTIKMSGHPPFAAQLILNGHEYVACKAQRVGVCYTKEGNCFTQVPDQVGLARIADTVSSPEAVGRLGQVIDRWIYTAALCYGLDLAEQKRSTFRCRRGRADTVFRPTWPSRCHRRSTRRYASGADPIDRQRDPSPLHHPHQPTSAPGSAQPVPHAGLVPMATTTSSPRQTRPLPTTSRRPHRTSRSPAAV